MAFIGQDNVVDGQLHTPDCKDSQDDIKRMLQVLLKDPEAVNRPQAASKKFTIIETPIYTPIHDAAIHNHKHCVEFLLENGADPNSICATNNRSPIESALSSLYNMDDKTNIIEMLLRSGASPNNTWDDEASRTAYVHQAIESKQNHILRLLLEHGAETEHLVTNDNGDLIPKACKHSYRLSTPLQNALTRLNADAIKLLFLHGNNIKNYRYKFFNPMHEDDESEINSVPHFIIFWVDSIVSDPMALDILEISLQDLLDNATKVIEAYKTCGGDMWTKARDPTAPAEAPEENIEELLNRRPELVSKLSPLAGKIKELMHIPLDLAEQCRVVIQKCIGRNFWNATDDIEVPKSLSDFLLLYLNE